MHAVAVRKPRTGFHVGLSVSKGLLGRLFVCAAALALSAAASTAAAAGWGALMKDSPIADFSDEDVRQYLEAVHSLLEAPMPAAPARLAQRSHRRWRAPGIVRPAEGRRFRGMPPRPHQRLFQKAEG